MKRATLRLLSLRKQRENPAAMRFSSSFSERLHREMTARELPLFFDYLHPQPSHLLDLTLRDLFPGLGSFSTTQTALPSIAHPSQLPPAHHLVYFPPQVTLSQLLPDGTDSLHAPGSPFNRRLWVGGRVRFPATGSLLLDGGRAVCIEGIRDVIVKGQQGEEKIIVKIERRIGTVRENEAERDVRNRIWRDSDDEELRASITENRDLVFMRDKTADQLDQDKAKFSQASRTIKSSTDPEFCFQINPTEALLFRFSALTFNAHLIHLDKGYTRNIEGYRNLLVHGPLTLTLLLTAIRQHLDGKGLVIKDIEYKNLTPVYVQEQLSVCGKPKPNKDNTTWDVWIEGKDGGLAVRGTAHIESA